MIHKAATQTITTHSTSPETSETKTIKLLIVDDHAMVRESVKMYLSFDKSLEVIGEASTGQEAIEEGLVGLE
jgi:two-component system, NarL family, response regulator LiaR